MAKIGDISVNIIIKDEKAVSQLLAIKASAEETIKRVDLLLGLISQADE